MQKVITRTLLTSAKNHISTDYSRASKKDFLRSTSTCWRITKRLCNLWSYAPWSSSAIWCHFAFIGALWLSGEFRYWRGILPNSLSSLLCWSTSKTHLGDSTSWHYKLGWLSCWSCCWTLSSSHSLPRRRLVDSLQVSKSLRHSFGYCVLCSSCL